jgi:hypothetical protein
MGNVELRLDWITPDMLDRAIGRQCELGADADREAFATMAGGSREFVEYLDMLAHAFAFERRRSLQEILATALSIGIEMGLALANEQPPKEEDAA